ncbi:hypothetical protein BJV74DRAFT_839032 [Russula compacta]|nr:hypothetical protein BJV74DRAFT_839032 [Russula compacta]
MPAKYMVTAAKRPSPSRILVAAATYSYYCLIQKMKPLSPELTMLLLLVYCTRFFIARLCSGFRCCDSDTRGTVDACQCARSHLLLRKAASAYSPIRHSAAVSCEPSRRMKHLQGPHGTISWPQATRLSISAFSRLWDTRCSSTGVPRRRSQR